MQFVKKGKLNKINYKIIAMESGTPNPESDAALKKRSMDYILREICRRDAESGVPFSFDEIEKFFKLSYDQKYLKLNLRDLLNGLGLVEIQDDIIALNDQGRKYCKENLD
jgi:hypothetical protein